MPSPDQAKHSCIEVSLSDEEDPVLQQPLGEASAAPGTKEASRAETDRFGRRRREVSQELPRIEHGECSRGRADRLAGRKVCTCVLVSVEKPSEETAALRQLFSIASPKDDASPKDIETAPNPIPILSAGIAPSAKSKLRISRAFAKCSAAGAPAVRDEQGSELSAADPSLPAPSAASRAPSSDVGSRTVAASARADASREVVALRPGQCMPKKRPRRLMRATSSVDAPASPAKPAPPGELQLKLPEEEQHPGSAEAKASALVDLEAVPDTPITAGSRSIVQADSQAKKRRRPMIRLRGSIAVAMAEASGAKLLQGRPSREPPEEAEPDKAANTAAKQVAGQAYLKALLRECEQVLATDGEPQAKIAKLRCILAGPLCDKELEPQPGAA